MDFPRLNQGALIQKTSVYQEKVKMPLSPQGSNCITKQDTRSLVSRVSSLGAASLKKLPGQLTARSFIMKSLSHGWSSRKAYGSQAYGSHETVDKNGDKQNFFIVDSCLSFSKNLPSS